LHRAAELAADRFLQLGENGGEFVFGDLAVAVAIERREDVFGTRAAGALTGVAGDLAEGCGQIAFFEIALALGVQL